jgi:hypothetical protein
MKFIELVIDESQEFFAIDAISIVSDPAIESEFIALKNQKQKILFKQVNEEKRLLIGPALIPDLPIYRQDNNGEEFYVYFSKKTVRKAMELFSTQSNQNNWTLEHDQDIQGLSVVESWIVESKEQDKSALYGLDVPVGSWLISCKVNNDAIWEKYVKSGEVLGFSIEGWFMDKFQVIQNNEKLMKSIEDLCKTHSPVRKDIV